MDTFGFTQERQICLAFWVPWLSFWALGRITRMDISHIKSFEQLQSFLRQFVNCHGDLAPYDSGAVAALLGAVLDNVRTYGSEVDLEEMQERLTPEQAATLRQIVAHLCP